MQTKPKPWAERPSTCDLFPSVNSFRVGHSWPTAPIPDAGPPLRRHPLAESRLLGLFLLSPQTLFLRFSCTADFQSGVLAQPHLGQGIRVGDRIRINQSRSSHSYLDGWADVGGGGPLRRCGRHRHCLPTVDLGVGSGDAGCQPFPIKLSLGRPPRPCGVCFPPEALVVACARSPAAVRAAGRSASVAGNIFWSGSHVNDWSPGGPLVYDYGVNPSRGV